MSKNEKEAVAQAKYLLEMVALMLDNLALDASLYYSYRSRMTEYAKDLRNLGIDLCEKDKPQSSEGPTLFSYSASIVPVGRDRQPSGIGDNAHGTS